jgi:Tfp pilus assembly protein PilF
MPGSSADGLLDSAKSLLEANDSAAAARLGEFALRSVPQVANALLQAGRTAAREGRWTEALDLFQRCVVLAPSAAAPYFWLGNSLCALGDNRAAVAAFSEAWRLSPGDAATAFNLGLSLVSLDDTESAGQAFVWAARASGATQDSAAHQHAIECAVDLSEAPASKESPLHSQNERADVTLSVVCCSITPEKVKNLRANLSQLLAGRRWEFVLIGDARSLCEGYQRGVAQSTGEIIIFCHDDIEIIVDDLYTRLVDAMGDADIVGVAGTTLVSGPAIFWSRHPHCHGWVTQRNPDGELLPTPMSLAPPRVDGAQALDGLFFAARRSVFERLEFDAVNFDGFHFYDLDFTYRAFLAGLRVRIQCDILIIHASSGSFDEVYLRYAERFAAKFPDNVRAAPSSPLAFKTFAPNKDALRNFYSWLGHWAAASAA